MGAIDSVKSLSSTSFVMTGSRSSAAINVWTSLLGLNFAGGFNFREQFYRLQSCDKLYFESMAKVFESSHASVYLEKNVAKSAGLKVIDGEDHDPQIPVATHVQQQNADPFTVALDALFDESTHVEVTMQSSDSESDGEEEIGVVTDFQQAWFAAKEPAEESK